MFDNVPKFVVCLLFLFAVATVESIITILASRSLEHRKYVSFLLYVILYAIIFASCWHYRMFI